MARIAASAAAPAAPRARRRSAARVLSLQQTAAGWALLDNYGHLVFAARGRDARRKCLARAAELGITHLRFDEQATRGSP